ncbi:MAG: hypothetical protein KA763_14300 [Xanthomonadales bacterium]|nr:hypothetical protein [Xanthomonadales bacterium]
MMPEFGEKQLRLFADKNPFIIDRVAAELSRHRGKSAAISRSALAAATGTSDRQVRLSVAFLTVSKRLLVGSRRESGSGGGYYAIITKRELKAEAADLAKQGASIFARMRALVGSEEAAKLIGQTNLFSHTEGAR